MSGGLAGGVEYFEHAVRVKQNLVGICNRRINMERSFGIEKAVPEHGKTPSELGAPVSD
jgi:hypothetical protein